MAKSILIVALGTALFATPLLAQQAVQPPAQVPPTANAPGGAPGGPNVALPPGPLPVGQATNLAFIAPVAGIVLGGLAAAGGGGGTSGTTSSTSSTR